MVEEFGATSHSAREWIPPEKIRRHSRILAAAEVTRRTITKYRDLLKGPFRRETEMARDPRCLLAAGRKTPIGENANRRKRRWERAPLGEITRRRPNRPYPGSSGEMATRAVQHAAPVAPGCGGFRPASSPISLGVCWWWGRCRPGELTLRHTGTNVLPLCSNCEPAGASKCGTMSGVDSATKATG